MKKIHDLANLLGILCILGILALHVSAQKVSAVKNDTTQKQAKTSIVARYIDISNLPMNEKQELFRSISDEDRAAVMKFHLAFQFVKRPNLTADQKTLLIDSSSIITAELYSRTDTAKKEAEEKVRLLEPQIKTLFPGKDGFEIFFNIGGTKDDIAILQKYEDLTPLNDLQRKAVFRKSSAQEKRDFWRVHVAFFMTTHADLTFSQRNLFQI